MKLQARRRSFYTFICAMCCHERRSVIYDFAARLRVCRKCRTSTPPKNMQPLFDVDKFLAGAEKAGEILNRKHAEEH